MSTDHVTPGSRPFGPLQLLKDPAELHHGYVSGSPFEHVVIDGLFDPTLLSRVEQLFPGPEEEGWRRFDNSHERKLGFQIGMDLAPEIGHFLRELSSAPVLEFLEILTGIDGLIPDPYFGGGGLHRIEKGGFLDMHVDFNWHPKLRLHRRLNMLIYLNQSWTLDHGGALELGGRNQDSVQIEPVFNRTVVFSTTESSRHGHPKPVSSTAPDARRSVSLYYYTADPAEGSAAPHDTIFE